MASIGTGEGLTTRAVEIAGNGLHRDDALAVLHAVGLLVDGETPHDGRRFGGRVHAGSLVDLLDRYVADLSCALGRHALLGVKDARGELIETVAPQVDKLGIVELFTDDDVQHGHGQGCIGAGTQLDMDVSAGGKPVDTRVDHDDAGTAAHCVDDGMTEEAVRGGLERMLAPNHQDLGQLVLGVVPATGQSARVVPLGVRAAGHVDDGGQTRGVARVAGLRVAVVRGAEHHGRIQRHRAALAASAREAHDGLGTVVLDGTLVVLFQDLEGLVPGAFLPLVGLAAELRVALHRRGDASGIVNVFLQENLSWIQTSLEHGMVLVAFDLLESPVLVDIQLQAPAYGVVTRGRPYAGARDGVVAIGVPPRFPEVVDLGQCG